MKKLLHYPHTHLDAVLPELGPCHQDGFSVASLDHLFEEMVDLMRSSGGIGLAANQCGVNFRVFVTDIPGDNGPRIYINPIVVDDSGPRIRSVEGCLSFPGVQNVVERPQEVIVEAIMSPEDYEEGARSRVQLEGLEAVCVQHEIDHLNGIHFGTGQSALKRDQLKRKVEKALRVARR